MIVKLIFKDPISVDDKKSTLNISYPNVTVSYWKNLKDFNNDVDITKILDDILEKLDATIVYDNMQFMTTSNMVYHNELSNYLYYSLRLTNQFTYNKYIDKLINRHIQNLIFEHNNPIIEKQKVTKNKVAKVKNTKGKYIRQSTFDLFTNQDSYIYSNSITGDTIYSPNPDLLEELNGTKKKPKRTKVVSIPMSSMTFTFKRKT